MTSTPGLDLTPLPADGGTVLVAGDGGLIGSHAARTYAELGWTVHGVSRRELPGASWHHHRVDLLDAEEARAGLAALGEVTHLVFGAYIERADEAEAIEVNDALLRNTLDALRAAGAPLRHVTLYQGGKAYGHHLGYFTTPAKETAPRLIAPHFYYTQEDLLREAGAERGFAFTALRPEGVTGYATGNPMNLLLVIGVYAAISAPAPPTRRSTRPPTPSCWPGPRCGRARRRPRRTRSSTSPTATSSAGPVCGRGSPSTSGWSSPRRSRCR
jgi:nucleoside-diphosphate-sugar epimerase